MYLFLIFVGNSDYQNVLRLFEEHGEDWTELVDLWESTREIRMNIWKSSSSGLTLADLYESFTFLTDTRSDELILDDFLSLYPNAFEYFEKWRSSNYMKVLNKARCVRDDYAKLIISWIDVNENTGNY